MLRLLDRYVLREWLRILLITAIGFPLIVVAFELTDNLDDHLSRGIDPANVALGYLFSMPDKIFLILPAAVLFATVFTLGALNRHTELTAMKASGRSLWRTLIPLLLASLGITGAGWWLGEWAPNATTRQLELLGEREVRSQTTRHNFVYRADHGWVYAARSLNLDQRRLQDLVMEREGTGPDYPTLAMHAPQAQHDSLGRWTLVNGRMRILPDAQTALTFAYDSARMAQLVETPEALLLEPKDPRAMTYAELGAYIDDLERSGGDGRKLRVRQALKMAIPFTCVIITLFAAPLALAAPRSSGAVGVGISLAVTVIFLTMVQLAEAIGAGGLLPPLAAAWAPNVVFGVAGLAMLARAPS
jgi:lipopolysaccharide export system permease protein